MMCVGKGKPVPGEGEREVLIDVRCVWQAELGFDKP